MRVNSLPQTISQSLKSINPAEGSKLDFKTILQSVIKDKNFGFDSSIKNLDQLRHKIGSAERLSSAQILQYQININELNLRVELVSKAAESAVSLVRKLQNAQ